MTSRGERWSEFDQAVARVMSTLTDADWRAMFRRERAGVHNPVAEGISLFLRSRVGKVESERGGKISTDL